MLNRNDHESDEFSRRRDGARKRKSSAEEHDGQAKKAKEEEQLKQSKGGKRSFLIISQEEMDAMIAEEAAAAAMEVVDLRHKPFRVLPAKPALLNPISSGITEFLFPSNEALDRLANETAVPWQSSRSLGFNSGTEPLVITHVEPEVDSDEEVPFERGLGKGKTPARRLANSFLGQTYKGDSCA
ncbi:hypothetical protein BCR33DRAFT_854387 [Rhizoclosmatium globosum]|uniref:Uncharacterized protein n=1 Tax=Rhizoclosmatium globosum TaxID=329046 RepID=A0A1Y2BT54_9FUNG|nr:hypothetical protein BCR33DRAFT_854387 [Rhizoclosmatium globosum]|eukprot:ORY37929.1 hypothetical protein BCR33DRAFT_854387 [Rhizoclosmatium globosum]